MTGGQPHRVVVIGGGFGGLQVVHGLSRANVEVTLIDYDNLAVTLIADFDAPIDRVWELWSDPRKLERWWGPPDYPATVETHDLAPGGRVKYLMTGPEGETHHSRTSSGSRSPPT